MTFDNAQSEQDAAANPDPAAIDPTQAKVEIQWKHDAPLINCRFDPQGRFVFATAEDFSVARWELATGNRVVMKAHDSWPRAMAFSTDAETVVTGACDDTLIWWPTAAENPEPIRKVVAHKGWIRAVAVSPDGKLLASGGNDRVVKLWNMDDGNLVAELAGHERDVYSVRFHPNGQFLLSGDLMGKVHQWELATSKILRTFDASALHTYNGGQQVDYGGVRDIELSPDQTRLICAGLHKATNPLGAVSDPLVLQFDWEATTLLKSHTADLRGIAWRAIWHAQNFLFAASGGSGGGFLLFWKPDEEAPFHKLQLPNIVREMDLHPDGRQIATAHHDQHLRITKI